MLNNKQIITYLLGLSTCLLIACSTSQIPVAYNTKVGEIRTDPYGCWADVVLKETNDTLSGELICLENDTVFILGDHNQLYDLRLRSIKSYRIYTYKNRTGTYATLTAIYTAPSLVGAIAYPEYAGSFLALGSIPAIPGVVQTLIEASGDKGIISGTPDYGHINIGHYARFPYGRPQGLDLSQLTLKNDTNK